MSLAEAMERSYRSAMNQRLEHQMPWELRRRMDSDGDLRKAWLEGYWQGRMEAMRMARDIVRDYEKRDDKS